MRQGSDVVNEDINLLVSHPRCHVDHLLAVEIARVTPPLPGVIVFKLAAEIASVQSAELGTVEHHLTLAVVAMTFHAVVREHVPPSLQVGFVLRFLG